MVDSRTKEAGEERMRWTIELESNEQDQAAAVRRLRAFLKYALRVFNLRCVSAVEVKADGTPSTTTGALPAEQE